MFYFFCGLIIGLVIYLFRDYHINRQLNEILHSLSQVDQVQSLSKAAQIRRKVNRLYDKFEYNKLELNLYRHLIEESPLGYLRINHDNCVIECNNQARKLLNIERWHTRSMRFFLELVRSYELDQLIQQTRKTQKKLILEWQFFSVQNNLYDWEQEEYDSLINEAKGIHLKAYSYPCPGGEVAVFIEDQQLIKDLMIRRDQAYSDLSHELRTPLTSILLLVETSLKYTNNDSKNWLEKIYEEVNRLIDLVKNWLEIYQLQQNPYEALNFQNLDLKQLILSAWKSMEILAKQKSITFLYQGEEKVTIDADIKFLTQVFVNLFDNSIKYSDRPGEIQVLVSHKVTNKSKPIVKIEIIDSGIGFNAEDLPYIFERLYRGDKSRTRKSHTGSGLGLSIVKQIIQNHQGRIKARNHPQTKGAWFIITLPQSNDLHKNE